MKGVRDIPDSFLFFSEPIIIMFQLSGESEKNNFFIQIVYYKNPINLLLFVT